LSGLKNEGGEQRVLTDAKADTRPRQIHTRGENAALLHDLLKLTNRLMAPFSTHLEHRYRISLNQFRLLMTIGALGRSASHELAEMTGVNVMSVSRAVAALQREGRIDAKRDPRNHRRKCLTLTDEGERLYAIMRPQTESVADYLFSELSDDEIDQLGTIVSRLIATLEARDDGGQSLFLERTKPDASE
jgi:DNA-binding MarR family transcriptional regulator